MSEIIRNLMNNRLVTVTGPSGIGKTSVVRHLAIHFQERNVFKDGIVFLALSEKNYTNDLISLLYNHLKMGLNTSELEELNALPYEVIDDQNLNKLDLNKIVWCLK